VTDLYRSPVDVGHFHRDVVGHLGLLRGHGAHGAHHGALEGSGLHGLDVGLVHGHVAAHLNVAHGYAGGHQRLLKGEGAADEETHIPVLPVFRGVGELLGEHAVLIHPVAGDVGDDVPALP